VGSTRDIGIQVGILFGKPEGKEPLGNLDVDMKTLLKLILKENSRRVT
jgi:hypothetical protein